MKGESQASQRNSPERHGCAMQANETPECATAFRIRLWPDSAFTQFNLKTICNQGKLGLSFKIQARRWELLDKRNSSSSHTTLSQ